MARRETLFMETTEVSATRSAGEITEVLIQSGATQIATDYKNGKIVGLRWTFNADGQDLLFSMPARVDPLFEIFKKRRAGKYGNYLSPADLISLREKSERVAWRQLLRWTQAQLAMMETGMVKPQEVFLPYWQPSGTRTLFEMMEGQRFKALSAPSESLSEQ